MLPSFSKHGLTLFFADADPVPNVPNVANVGNVGNVVKPLPGFLQISTCLYFSPPTCSG